MSLKQLKQYQQQQSMPQDSATYVQQFKQFNSAKGVHFPDKRAISFEELNFGSQNRNQQPKKINSSFQLKSIQGMNNLNSDMKMTPTSKPVSSGFQSSYSLGRQPQEYAQYFDSRQNSKINMQMNLEPKEDQKAQMTSMNKGTQGQYVSQPWEELQRKQHQRMTLKKIIDGSQTELLNTKENQNDQNNNNSNVLVIEDRFIDTKQQVRLNLMKSSSLIRNVSNSRLLLANAIQSPQQQIAAGRVVNKQYYLGNTTKLSKTECAKNIDGVNAETAEKGNNAGSSFQNQYFQQYSNDTVHNHMNKQNQLGILLLPVNEPFQPVQAITKTTIQKFPSSRHQPSRMKFTAISQASPSRSFLPTPTNEGRAQDFDISHQVRPFTGELSQLSQSKYYMGKLDKDYNAKINSKNNKNPGYFHNHQNHHHLESNEINSQESLKKRNLLAEPFGLTHVLSQSQQAFLFRSLNNLGDTLQPSSMQLSFSEQQQQQSQHLEAQIKGNSSKTGKKVIQFSLENNNDSSQLEEENNQIQSKKAIQQTTGKHGILTKPSILIHENAVKNENDVEESDKSEEVSLNGSDSEQEGDHKKIRKRRQKTSAERQRERDRKDKQNLESLKKIMSYTEISGANKKQIEKTNLEQLDQLKNVHLVDDKTTSKGDINFDEATIKKYQSHGGIDIEKEIMEQKINQQRSHQKEVAQLISTIQNNAMENYQNHTRMEQSQAFKMMERKSKILEENKQLKKQQFEENLKALKVKNQYEGVDIAVLEQEFATGGKFSQKNYNNLKINRNFKRTKQQIADVFKNTLKLLQRLNINPKEVMTTKVFSTKPYEKESSYLFFEKVKANDYDQAAFLLKYNKYLVYDYDYLFMTPLHWACKRGFYKMASILIQYNSDLESEDMVGRTPLFFAVQNNYEDIIELLLVNKASPYKTKYADYQALAKTYAVSKMLSICRRLHWAIKLNPNPNKGEQWKKEVQVIYSIRQQQLVKDEELKKKKPSH